jgi:hypothetical protein
VQRYRWATRATDPESPARWHEWRGVENNLSLMAPAVRYVDEVEADVRRANSNLAGPLEALPNLWRTLRGR